MNQVRDILGYSRSGVHSPSLTPLEGYVLYVGLGAADKNNPRVKAIIAVMADILNLERMTSEFWDEYAKKLTDLKVFEHSLSRYLGNRPKEGNADVRE